MRPSLRPAKRSARRGLSPLEFVLALPILLFVMALMINFGTAASWKVRGLGMARNQLWSHRQSRSGGSYAQPDPSHWPAPDATVGVGGPGPCQALADPRVDQPVARGFTIVDFIVDRDLLDPTRGMLRGDASIDRAFRLLRSMGRYRLHSHTEALDDRWQFEGFGLPGTRDRRIPVLYTLPPTPATMGLANRYIQAAAAIFYFPLQRYLYPLDNDQEHIFWGRWFSAQGVPNWSDSPPDFYRAFAWLPQFCHLDEQEVQRLVDDLIDRIQGRGSPSQPGYVAGIAQRMTDAFISFYQRVIRELQNLLSATPPPSAASAAWMRKQITDLQSKISQLQRPLRTP